MKNAITLKALLLVFGLFALNIQSGQGLTIGQTAHATTVATTANADYLKTPTKEISSRLRRLKSLNATDLAIRMLVNGSVKTVSWVMDEKNTSVRWKRPPSSVGDPEGEKHCRRIAKERGFEYGMTERVEFDGKLAYFKCFNPYLNSYGSYSPELEGTLTFDQVSNQILANGRAGNQDSINLLKVVYDDIQKNKPKPTTPTKPSVVVTQPKPTQPKPPVATQPKPTNPPAKPIATPKPTNPPAKPANPPKPVKPVLNKPETKPETQPKPETPPATQPTQPEKHIKTDNKELDEIFKDATPTDGGNKSYHLPNMTQAELVEKLEKIKDAKKSVSKDGKSAIIKLPDGKWINTYPGRTSTKNPGWEIYISPTSKNPKYKGDTKK